MADTTVAITDDASEQAAALARIRAQVALYVGGMGARGRNFYTDVAVRYGFADVGLHRIFAQTMAVNVGSRAVMTSVGMTFARAFVSGEDYPDTVEGAEQGEVEYELTRETWLGR